MFTFLPEEKLVELLLVRIPCQGNLNVSQHQRCPGSVVVLGCPENWKNNLDLDVMQLSCDKCRKFMTNNQLRLPITVVIYAPPPD